MFDTKILWEHMFDELEKQERNTHMAEQNNKQRESIEKYMKSTAKSSAKKHDGDIIELTLYGGKKIYVLFLKNTYIAFSAKDEKEMLASRRVSVTAIYDYRLDKINDSFWAGKANIKEYGKLIWKKEITPEDKFNNELDSILDELEDAYNDQNSAGEDPYVLLKKIINNHKK